LKQGAVYSIGHGIRKIEDFIFLLKKYNIQYLVDVRSIPYSRFNPQYRQPALKKLLEQAGINYIFMGNELGGRPKDASCYDENGKVSYAKIKEHLFFKQGIERLIKASEQGIPLAMMCSESKPEECHRSKLIAPALEKENIVVIHIDEKGELEDQNTVLKKMKGKSKNPGLFPG
jgi:uncharacterized protein (DUF488 family)